MKLLYALIPFLVACQTAPVAPEKTVRSELDTTHRVGDVLPIQYACGTEGDGVYWSEHLGQSIDQTKTPSCGQLVNAENPNQPVLVMLAGWLSGGYTQDGEYGSLWVAAAGDGRTLYVTVPDLGGKHRIGGAPQKSKHKCEMHEKEHGVQT